jgi:hypothetical protein
MVDRTHIYKYPHQVSIKQLVNSTHKSFDFVLGLQVLPNQILYFELSAYAHYKYKSREIYFFGRKLSLLGTELPC